jgi:hypothetical protein
MSPVLASSAYNTAEDVLNRIRLILNDSEIAGGDVITDTAPFTFELINAGFERVQIELASVGVETMMAEAWVIGLPVMPTLDPEARMIIDDTGTNIIYPNGVGNSFSMTPQLPTDLVLPVRLYERQSGTANFKGQPMKQPNGGLLDLMQQSFLIDWEWKSDGLRFRGATQSQDVKIEYEKHMQKIAATTDPVPIRGVTNAAAYYSAMVFTASRGGAILPEFKDQAASNIQLYKQISARRRQRKQVRRQPYSGRGGRQQSPIL